MKEPIFECERMAAIPEVPKFYFNPFAPAWKNVASHGESNEEFCVNFTTFAAPGSCGYVFSKNFSEARWYDFLGPAMQEVLREMDDEGALTHVCVHRVELPNN